MHALRLWGCESLNSAQGEVCFIPILIAEGWCFSSGTLGSHLMKTGLHNKTLIQILNLMFSITKEEIYSKLHNVAELHLLF